MSNEHVFQPKQQRYWGLNEVEQLKISDKSVSLYLRISVMILVETDQCLQNSALTVTQNQW